MPTVISSNSGTFPGFANLKPLKERRPTCDFVISGQAHERRAQIAIELIEKGLSVVLTAAEPDLIRDDLLERARGTLHVQKHHNIFSISRIHHSISNEVPILIEYEGSPPYLSPYCITSPKAKFVDTCVDFAKTDHSAYAIDTLERFRRDMPVSEIIPALLRDTRLVTRS